MRITKGGDDSGGEGESCVSSSSSPFLLVLFPLFLVVFFGFSFSRVVGAREEDEDGGERKVGDFFEASVCWRLGGRRSAVRQVTLLMVDLAVTRCLCCLPCLFAIIL